MATCLFGEPVRNEVSHFPGDVQHRPVAIRTDEDAKGHSQRLPCKRLHPKLGDYAHVTPTQVVLDSGKPTICFECVVLQPNRVESRRSYCRNIDSNMEQIAPFSRFRLECTVWCPENVEIVGKTFHSEFKSSQNSLPSFSKPLAHTRQ